MSAVNGNDSEAPSFLLTRIPGLDHGHDWISFPVSLLYVMSFVGNCTILFVVKTEPHLHTPMYLLLSLLAITDLGLSLATLPTMLSIFWFNSRFLSPDACFSQLFFIHTFSVMESSVLLAMAFDRFIAICNPLRYASILTGPVIVKIGFATVFRSAGLHFPLPFLLKRLRYCGVNELSHAFCIHSELITLSCSSTRINSIYGLFIVLSTFGIDSLFIFLSYVMIIKTVFKIASREEQLKVMGSCVSHICAVLLFYTPLMGLTMIHRFLNKRDPSMTALMAYVHFLLPPVMNPTVYSVKTKEIQKAVLKMLCQKRILSRQFS
ncbi:olfactory receptor 51G2-like [Rhinatrema bivittatum]|uniref:olfactory receptor 51G2-like n=1 Tax=Rhinatrema bivittatum TaxID=194408 RepID=UPI00112A0C6E|nr:olfactory receptor 51G2-like [Rhinatrema bivittatum]